jgi:diadenosine tetraphosphate (Ap4A) HIT family hydrolase
MTDPYRPCQTCGFAVETPVAELSSATLGVFSDARFPGRCVLVLDRHAEHFEALAAETAARFTADAQRAGRLIRSVTGCQRINYVMLCNQVPHLHLHLFPRGGPGDPDPRVSPWELSEPESPLASTQVAALRERLVAALRAEG